MHRRVTLTLMKFRDGGKRSTQMLQNFLPCAGNDWLRFIFQGVGNSLLMSSLSSGIVGTCNSSESQLPAI